MTQEPMTTGSTAYGSTSEGSTEYGSSTQGSTAYGSTAQGSTGMGAEDDRSIGELFSAISSDLSTLMRQEVALAKAEVRKSATEAGAGVGMLAGAGVAGHFVLLFLSIAAWWGIAQWIGQAWSGVIIAVVWAIVALILYSVGRGRLKRVEGVPQTVETTKQIPDALAGREDNR
jgi:Putative Actinobacterial Holin-X, holin superfamily III